MRKAIDPFPNDEASHEWLNSIKTSTRKLYKTSWKRFVEFTQLTGDEILADKQADKNFTWEKKTLEFKEWLINEKKLAEKSSVTFSMVVRSFFAYHRTPLEFRTSEKRRLTEAKAKYEDYRYSKKDLEKMASVSNLDEKYVLVVGKSFGLRAGDFLALTRGDFEAYLDREVPIAIGVYNTQKKNVKAYPIIDRDALPVIKLMLKTMDREGRTQPNEKMLKIKDSIQLSRIVRRLTERADIKIGNKRVRFHCLRKFLIDRLSSYMSQSKWKQIVGKKIDEGAYVSPDSLQEDYARAMEEISFSRMIDGDDLQLVIQKEALKTIARIRGIPETSIKKIFRMKRMTINEEIDVLEKLIEETDKNNHETASGGLPFQIEAQKTLADIIVGAVNGAKKQLEDENTVSEK